jgi:hypothetical protein
MNKFTLRKGGWALFCFLSCMLTVSPAFCNESNTYVISLARQPIEDRIDMVTSIAIKIFTSNGEARFDVSVIKWKAPDDIGWSYTFSDLARGDELALDGYVYRIGDVKYDDGHDTWSAAPVQAPPGSCFTHCNDFLKISKTTDRFSLSAGNAIVLTRSAGHAVKLGACGAGLVLNSIFQDEEGRWEAQIKVENLEHDQGSLFGCNGVKSSYVLSAKVGQVISMPGQGEYGVENILPATQLRGDWVVLVPVNKIKYF